MRTRALWLAIVAIMTVATPALAEQGGREAARRHYAEGQALFNAGNYQAALAEFRAAYEASPHPVPLKSQAECLERMGRIHEAVELFERYLAEMPTARDAAQIRQRIAAHRARPGRLRVTSNPPGATVTLDGQPIQGVTPLDIQVPAGQHAVAIQLQGYEMRVEEFNMPFAGSHTIAANLMAAGARPATPAAPTPVAPTPQPQRRRWTLTTPVWAMIGLTGAGLVTGIVCGALALSDQNEFDSLYPSQWPEEETQIRDLSSAGTAKALVADIAFGVTAAAAITGIVLFFVQNMARNRTATERRHHRGFALTPILTMDGGGVGAAGTF